MCGYRLPFYRLIRCLEGPFWLYDAVDQPNRLSDHKRSDPNQERKRGQCLLGRAPAMLTSFAVMY